MNAYKVNRWHCWTLLLKLYGSFSAHTDIQMPSVWFTASTPLSSSSSNEEIMVACCQKTARTPNKVPKKFRKCVRRYSEPETVRHGRNYTLVLTYSVIYDMVGSCMTEELIRTMLFILFIYYKIVHEVHKYIVIQYLKKYIYKVMQ